MTNIGQKIKKVRELKGYTQEYLAEQLNISQKTYSLIESDQTKIDLDRLQKIADTLEIDLMNLLAFDDKNIFNNNFHDKVETSQNYVVNESSFEEERKAHLKYIEHLEKENDFLKTQLDKILNQ